MTRLEFTFPQITTGDLDIPIIGQLPAANRSRRYHVRVMFSRSAPQAKGMFERFVATGWRLSVVREAEVCEGTGHKTPSQLTQNGMLKSPISTCHPKYDPQQMHYCHDEKQHGSDRHIGFSVQSMTLSRVQTAHDHRLEPGVVRCLVGCLTWPGGGAIDNLQHRRRPLFRSKSTFPGASHLDCSRATMSDGPFGKAQRG
jgi:hypothetical protein